MTYLPWERYVTIELPLRGFHPPQRHNAKKWFFSSILILSKETVPQFIQTKRQMRAGFNKYSDSSLNKFSRSNTIQKSAQSLLTVAQKYFFRDRYKKYTIYSRPRALDKSIFSKINKVLNIPGVPKKMTQLYNVISSKISNLTSSNFLQ